MPKKEVFDISPVKTNYKQRCRKDIKAMKNLSKFLYNSTVLVKRSDTSLPLQEIEENSLLLSCDEDTEKLSQLADEKIISRRQNRAKCLQTSPLSKMSLGVRNIPHTYESHSPNITLTSGKCKQIPPSFSKLVEKQEGLKNAIRLSRQAFSDYKLSSFFCFDSEFIKQFSESLSKVEHEVSVMETYLEKAVLKELSKANSVLHKESLFTSSDNDIQVDKGKTETCSLTPPKSEIGSEESANLSNTTFSHRKRKLATENSVKREGSDRKLRKCVVINPSVPKVITKMDSKESKTQSLPNDDSDSDSDVETKEGEYEVRKIQDYVRKPGGGYYYRVSWKGYESEEDTYEPADHLDGCDEALTEFFYKRLKERETAAHVDQLKDLILPSDARVKELLYKAFEKLLRPVSPQTMEKGIQMITSSKGLPFKSKEEIQEDILKFFTLRDPTQDRYKRLYASVVEQISFRELYEERQKQLADLRAWERSMNIICSDPAPLSVENNVDLTLPPLDFVYINEYIPGPNIIIPSDPVAGCECKECNSLQKACCANQMGSYFAYNKYGRLRVSLGTPIYECNKACKCSSDCMNRVVQNGRKIALAIFRTSNDRGWGVKALEPIKKDQFVSEYVGEVISSEEAEQRGLKYDTKGCTYLFDLDYNRGDQNPYTVDAVKYGNVSHFINHSCDPNLVVFNVWVNCLDPDLPKLGLFAARDIKKGEEITFDYNSGSTRQISIMDKIDDKEAFPLTPKKHETEEGSSIIPTTEFVRKTPRNRVLNVGKTECKCGAANCRKFFF